MKLAMCDDSEILCRYFHMVFSKAADVDFVGEAHNSAACVELVKRTEPDVLLLDIQMETDDAGLQIIEELLTLRPTMKIVILTVHKEDNYVFSAFASGVSDYIIKTAEAEEIVEKVLAVYQNTSTLRPEIAQILAKKSQEVQTMQKSLLTIVNQISKLSQSEFEVLKALYYGDSYKKIAAERFVEEGTIRTHGSRIINKFGQSNMQKLLKQLRELKVFELFET